MTHEVKIDEKYFDLIENGEKIYEVRLNDEKRKKFKVLDNLILKKMQNLDISLNTKIEELLYFSSFDAMLENLNLKDIGFAGKRKEEVLNVYHKFYSAEEELKYGVVVIKVKVLK